MNTEGLEFEEMPKVWQLPWQGGARIGKSNIGFPFAELNVNTEQLELRTADQQIFHFTPDQVNEVETLECDGPLPSAAIRIHHHVVEYPEMIVFLLFCRDARPFKDRITEMGFGLSPIKD